MSRIEEPLNVRTYTYKEVEDEKLYKILQLAMQVSSSSNQHPWELLIIKNKDTLKNLSISTPYAWIVKEASCAIIVLGNMNKTCVQRNLGSGLFCSYRRNTAWIYAAKIGCILAGCVSLRRKNELHI